MRKTYRDTARRRNTRLGEKYRIHGKINTLNRTWNNRKLEEEEAKTLLDAAERNNYRPIWEYQSKLRYSPINNQKHTSIKNEDGTYTQNTKQTLGRWTQRIAQKFQIAPEKEKPNIDHITEEEWEIIEQTIQQTKPKEPHTTRTYEDNKAPKVSSCLQHIREKHHSHKP